MGEKLRLRKVDLFTSCNAVQAPVSVFLSFLQILINVLAQMNQCQNLKVITFSSIPFFHLKTISDPLPFDFDFEYVSPVK